MKVLSKVNAITGLAELATAQTSQHPYPRGSDTFSQHELLKEGRGGGEILGKDPHRVKSQSMSMGLLTKTGPAEPTSFELANTHTRKDHQPYQN